MTQQLRAPSHDLIGKVLLGRYRVVRELAKGGMGVVYLARSEGAVGFVKPVVIKLLLPEHMQDDRFVGMFVREAQILSQLRHPSVVDVLEFGEQDGAYVLVLEYVRGYHFGQWLRYLKVKKRSAPVDMLVQVVIDVLEALQHAHNLVHPDGTPMQVVHRDVSPSNILLDQDGRARLLDFGVARMRGGAHDYKTQVEGIMGKLPYTAPEMFAGQDATPQSDLYACGVVLHEALLGHNVFRAEMQAATLNRVMTHVPESVEMARREVPVGLDTVLAKALAKAPKNRYADASEFAAALRQLQCEQESDLRAHLAHLLKNDFGAEMAKALNLESLADRDEAWRTLSQASPRAASRGRPISQEQPAVDDAALPAAPTAIGTTVAAARNHRSTPRQQPRTAEAHDIDAVDAGASPRARASDSAAPKSQAPVQPNARDAGATAPARTQARAPGPRGQNRAMLLGLCLVAGLATGAMALSLQRPTMQHASVPTVHVVQQPSKPSEPPITTVTTSVTTRTEPTPGEASRPPKPEDRPRRIGSGSAGLTQAVRRQQPKLEACFKQHSVALKGQPTTQLEFDLDAAGRLTHVQLSPSALASTALGVCLLQVARSTTFPAQSQAVSFAIPLTARLAPGG